MASSVREIPIACPVCGESITVRAHLTLGEATARRLAEVDVHVDSEALREHIATHEPHDPHR